MDALLRVSSECLINTQTGLKRHQAFSFPHTTLTHPHARTAMQRSTRTHTQKQMAIVLLCLTCSSLMVVVTRVPPPSCSSTCRIALASFGKSTGASSLGGPASVTVNSAPMLPEKRLRISLAELAMTGWTVGSCAHVMQSMLTNALRSVSQSSPKSWTIK